MAQSRPAEKLKFSANWMVNRVLPARRFRAMIRLCGRSEWRMRWILAAIAVLLLAAPADADIRVLISKSSQQMAVSVDGAQPMYWTISSGRDGYTTPSGSFRAIRLEEVYYSKKYDDAPMPNAVFFYGGYAIHGTFEERNLGRPVSHGCVRLSRAHAATLFALVRSHGMSNTRIVITDEPLRNVGPVARYDGRGGYVYDRGPAVYDRGYQGGRVVMTAPPNYRGFDEFGEPGVRVERQRRVYWDEAPPRRVPREPVPGRVYSDAEMRRVFRDNGWRE